MPYLPDDGSTVRLLSLLEIVSPSMQEERMLDYLREDWSRVCPDGHFKTDVIGNMEFSVIRERKYPTLALVAHSDTICVQITCGAGNGKYRFRSIGASPHMLLGQPVFVITEDNEIFNGVIGFDATSQFGQPKGLVFEDLWIDVQNPDASDKISVGDLAVLRPQAHIDSMLLTGSALDNRLGLFIMGEVLRHYARTPQIQANLTCVATVQEEVGLRGSAALKFTEAPDAVIVLDVDYATDIPIHHEDQMGRLRLGDGPGILRKADNISALRKRIKGTAIKLGIPLQISLGRFLYGGTDATPLQVAREQNGYPVCNVTIPCRYMHSPVETVSLDDVRNAVLLLNGFLEDMKK